MCVYVCVCMCIQEEQEIYFLFIRIVAHTLKKIGFFLM